MRMSLREFCDLVHFLCIENMEDKDRKRFESELAAPLDKRSKHERLVDRQAEMRAKILALGGAIG